MLGSIQTNIWIYFYRTEIIDHTFSIEIHKKCGIFAVYFEYQAHTSIKKKKHQPKYVVVFVNELRTNFTLRQIFLNEISFHAICLHYRCKADIRQLR